MKNSGKVLLGLALVIGGVAAAVVISKKVNEGEFDWLCKCCGNDDKVVEVIGEEEVIEEEETITEE